MLVAHRLVGEAAGDQRQFLGRVVAAEQQRVVDLLQPPAIDQLRHIGQHREQHERHQQQPPRRPPPRRVEQERRVGGDPRDRAVHVVDGEFGHAAAPTRAARARRNRAPRWRVWQAMIAPRSAAGACRSPAALPHKGAHERTGRFHSRRAGRRAASCASPASLTLARLRDLPARLEGVQRRARSTFRGSTGWTRSARGSSTAPRAMATCRVSGADETPRAPARTGLRRRQAGAGAARYALAVAARARPGRRLRRSTPGGRSTGCSASSAR